MKGNPSVLEDVGFLGIDEIHKWFTEQRKDVIRFFSEKQIHKLGLTGSDISEQDCLFLRIHGFPIIDEITEKEALKNKWISPYRNYNLAIELEDHEKKVYAAVSEPIKDVLSSFRGLHKTYKINNVEQFSTEIELVFACLGGKRIGHEYIDAKTMRESVARKRGYKEEYEHEKEPNELIKQIIEYWKPDNIKERCKAYKTCQEARNKILAKNRGKIDAVLGIIKANDVPTICFNESVEMITDLEGMLGRQAFGFYSQMKSQGVINPETGDYFRRASTGEIDLFGTTRLKKYAINGMKQGYIKYLLVAKAMDEGLDIPQINQVICTGGTTNPLTYLQRIARGKTIDSDNPDKVTTIINLYIDDFLLEGELVKSRDKQKLLLRQQDMDNVKYITSIEEL